jgi:hypothetical protein
MKLLAGIAVLGFASSVSAARAMPFDFTYSGGLVDFSVPASGDYQILAFGAQGGSAISGSLIGVVGLGAEIGGGNAPSAAASTSPPASRVSCGYFSLFGSGFAGLGFKIF